MMTIDLSSGRALAATDVEQLLLTACAVGPSGNFVPLYRRVGEDRAWTAACAHELEGHIAHKLSDALGDDQVPERWRVAHQRTSARLGAYMKLLDDTAAALSAQGIPVIALKNAGIARGIFRCLGCSPMGDLDLLVRREDFQRAHQVLVGEGFTCDSRDRHGPEDPAAGGLEYERLLDGSGPAWVELQWRPIAGRWIQPSQEPDTAELFARSIPIPGSCVRLLSPEDNLLQVCLHTAKHSYIRAPGLRLHTDVERIVRGTVIDWNLFLSRVTRLKVRTAVFFSLWLPSVLIGTPVPAEILHNLKPAAWKRRAILRSLCKAGFFYPNAGQKFTRSSYLLFNLLMYDDLTSVANAVFPGRDDMKARYGSSHILALPVHHARRLTDLCFRRTGF